MLGLLFRLSLTRKKFHFRVRHRSDLLGLNSHCYFTYIGISQYLFDLGARDQTFPLIQVQFSPQQKDYILWSKIVRRMILLLPLLLSRSDSKG